MFFGKQLFFQLNVVERWLISAIWSRPNNQSLVYKGWEWRLNSVLLIKLGLVLKAISSISEIMTTVCAITNYLHLNPTSLICSQHERIRLHFIGCSKSDDVEIKKTKVLTIPKWILINESHWIRIGYKIRWYVKIHLFLLLLEGI